MSETDRTDVVAAVIVRVGRVLLIQRHPRLDFGFKWCTPGGKVEAGESFETALFREVQEETGIGLASIRAWSGVAIHGASMLASHAYGPPIVARPCTLTTYDVSSAAHPEAQIKIDRAEAVGYGWFDVSGLEALRAHGLMTPGTEDVIGAMIGCCTRST